jgi:hypothetical protein
MYATAVETVSSKKVVIRKNSCIPAPPLLSPRIPKIYREVTKVPGAPGKVKEVVIRLPTPEPDIIERTIIEQPSQEMVNIVYERPATPPPQIVEKRIRAPCPAPSVNYYERQLPSCTTYYEAAPAPCCSVTAAAAPSPPIYTQISETYSYSQPYSCLGYSTASYVESYPASYATTYSSYMPCTSYETVYSSPSVVYQQYAEPAYTYATHYYY